MALRNNICVLVASIAIPLAIFAQQAAGRAEFDVVSIKRADPGNPGRMTQSAPGRFHGENLRLLELVMGAWHLNHDQIVGGPKWMETAGWDIVARFPAGTDPTRVAEMTKTMLAERFSLESHLEKRILPIYGLTIAKNEFKLDEGDGRSRMSVGPRLIHYGSGTMEQLAGQLSGYVGRQVIDETGKSGQYAIDLSFAPLQPGASEADSAQDPAPSIFEALEEQAGLKLVPGKGPVQVLVIDKADKPTAN